MKFTWPFASVVTLIVPRNVLPPANSPAPEIEESSSRSLLAKNSRR